MLLREVEILLGNLAGCNILFISIYSLFLAEEVMAVGWQVGVGPKAKEVVPGGGLGQLRTVSSQPMHHGGGGGVKNTTVELDTPTTASPRWCVDTSRTLAALLRLRAACGRVLSPFICLDILHTLETGRAEVVSVTCGHKEPTRKAFCLVGNQGFRAFGFLFPCTDYSRSVVWFFILWLLAAT